MHISEGVLPTWLLASGWAVTSLGNYIGLKKLSNENIPASALISSVLFVASLVHIPLGPTSVHLLCNGLAGIILGWGAFPAVFVALLLQALLFQFGGLIVLGVNTFNMAMPAVISYILTKRLVAKGDRRSLLLASIMCSCISVLGAGMLVSAELITTHKAFRAAAYLVIASHMPVAAVEAVITYFCLLFIKKNAPELLGEDL